MLLAVNLPKKDWLMLIEIEGKIIVPYWSTEYFRTNFCFRVFIEDMMFLIRTDHRGGFGAKELGVQRRGAHRYTACEQRGHFGDWLLAEQ